jgi:transcriptional regulator with XRE-family HTH domain
VPYTILGGSRLMKQQKTSDHHKNVPSTLAGLLKARREAAGLTPKEMAERLHVSRPYLARLETGEYTRPSPTVLGRIAQNLHVSPDDLYALTGYIPSTDLPSFSAYLRAKHPEWPDSAIAVLNDFHDFLRFKYSLD